MTHNKLVQQSQNNYYMDLTDCTLPCIAIIDPVSLCYEGLGMANVVYKKMCELIKWLSLEGILRKNIC